MLDSQACLKNVQTKKARVSTSLPQLITLIVTVTVTSPSPHRHCADNFSEQDLRLLAYRLYIHVNTTLPLPLQTQNCRVKTSRSGVCISNEAVDLASLFPWSGLPKKQRLDVVLSLTGVQEVSTRPESLQLQISFARV